jgi:hypothetical protein
VRSVHAKRPVEYGSAAYLGSYDVSVTHVNNSKLGQANRLARVIR